MNEWTTGWKDSWMNEGLVVWIDVRWRCELMDG